MKLNIIYVIIFWKKYCLDFVVTYFDIDKGVNIVNSRISFIYEIVKEEILDGKHDLTVYNAEENRQKVKK